MDQKQFDALYNSLGRSAQEQSNNYGSESNLRQVTQLSPEEKAADARTNANPAVRQELVDAIRNAKDPKTRAILEGELARQSGGAQEYAPTSYIDSVQYEAPINIVGQDGPDFGREMKRRDNQAKSDASPISTSVKRGWNQMTDSVGNAMDIAAGRDDAVIERMKRAQEYDFENPSPTANKQWMKDWEDGNTLGWMTNPAGFFGSNAEQLANSAPSMLGSIPGGIAGAAAGASFGPIGMVFGGVLGGALGSAPGSIAIETGSRIGQMMDKDGVDIGNAGAVKSWLSANRDKVLTEGMDKGMTVALADGVFQAIGMGILKAPAMAFQKAEARTLAGLGVNASDSAAVAAARNTVAYKTAMAEPAAALKAASTKAKEAARGTAAFFSESAGEFTGEYFGEQFATGEGNFDDALLEALMAGGQSAITTVAQMAGSKLVGAKKPDMSYLDELAAYTPTPADSPLTGAANVAQGVAEQQAAQSAQAQQFTANPSSDALVAGIEKRDELTAKAQQLQDMLGRMNPSHPDYAEISARLEQVVSMRDELASKISQTISSKGQSAQSRIAEIRSLIDSGKYEEHIRDMGLRAQAGESATNMASQLADEESTEYKPSDLLQQHDADQRELQSLIEQEKVNQRKAIKDTWLDQHIARTTQGPTSSFADMVEYENFLKEELDHIAQVRAEAVVSNDERRAQEADLAEQKLHDVAVRVEAQRKQETEAKRNALLDEVLANNPLNAKRAFDRALRAAGFNDTNFTDAEKAKIERFDGLRNIEDGQEQGVTDSHDFGIKERKEAPKSKFQHITDMLNSGWMLQGKQLVSRDGRKYNLKNGELAVAKAKAPKPAQKRNQQGESLATATEQVSEEAVQAQDAQVQQEPASAPQTRQEYVASIKALGDSLNNGDKVIDDDTGVEWVIENGETSNGTQFVRFNSGSDEFSFATRNGETKVLGDVWLPANYRIEKSASPQAEGVKQLSVRELALAEQRAAGWNPDWPFVPADLVNADFRQLINDDPYLSFDEKSEIFAAGKKLGVIPESEGVSNEWRQGKPVLQAPNAEQTSVSSQGQVQSESAQDAEAVPGAAAGVNVAEPEDKRRWMYDANGNVVETEAIHDVEYPEIPGRVFFTRQQADGNFGVVDTESGAIVFSDSETEQLSIAGLRDFIQRVGADKVSAELAKQKKIEVPADLPSADTVTAPEQSEASTQEQIAELQKQLESAGIEDRMDINGKLIELVTADAEQSIANGEMAVYSTGNGTFIALHPSAQNDGMIQATRYSDRGVMGDSQYKTVKEAVRDNGLWFKPKMTAQEANKAINDSIIAEADYQEQKRQFELNKDKIPESRWFSTEEKAEQYVRTYGYGKRKSDTEWRKANAPIITIEAGSTGQGGFNVILSEFNGEIEDKLKQAAELAGKTLHESRMAYKTLIHRLVGDNGQYKDDYNGAVESANRTLDATIANRIAEQNKPASVTADNKDESVSQDAKDKPQTRSSTIEEHDDGGWTVSLFDETGSFVGSKQFDVKSEALAYKLSWDKKYTTQEKPYHLQESDIDDAATLGYKSGLNGETSPPFGFPDNEELLLAWKIGNRKGIEASSSTVNSDSKQETTQLKKRIEEAEQRTAVNPTEAQKESGNYVKGKFPWKGMTVAIETPKNAERSGVDENGQPWKVTAPVSYGYFLGTKGADKEHLDVYIGESPESEQVFIINQTKVDSEKFDEHKVLIGFNSAEEAKAAYFGSFTDGFAPRVFGSIAGPFSVDEFKSALPKLEKSKPYVEGNTQFSDRVGKPLDAISVKIDMHDGKGAVEKKASEALSEIDKSMEFGRQLLNCLAA